MGRTSAGRRQLRCTVAVRRVDLGLGDEDGGAQIGRCQVAAAQVGTGEVG